MNRFSILFGICFLLMVSCNPKKATQESWYGTWIGASQKVDIPDVYQPYIRILEINKDSLINHDFKTKISVSSFYENRNDSLVFKDYAIARNVFKCKADNTMESSLITFYRKKETEQPIDTSFLKAQLQHYNWKTNAEEFSFAVDEEKYHVKKSEQVFQHYFEIQKYKDGTFLIKKGNQLYKEEHYQYVEQILSVTKNTILTYGWIDGKIQKKFYQKSAKRTLKEEKPTFQLCNPYLYKYNSSHRYYYQGTDYVGGLYAIRKRFNKEYIVPENNIEVGIVRIQFVVNCEGETGDFSLQTYSNDYQIQPMSAQITDQLLKITKSLDQWIPGLEDKEYHYIDTYIYLSFRIQNGKITYIYP